MSIRFSSEAREDLRQALDYLFDRNPPAAYKLSSDLTRLLAQLDESQFDGQPTRLKSELVRSWPLPPWRLYYQRRPESVLLVVRFYHQRRRPLTSSTRRKKPRA